MSVPHPVQPDRPLVTMGVNAYRQDRFVRQAVESAFAQTYQPLEIILSDDCSPDGTFRVMEEMAGAYRGPHLVRLNRNPVNLGIAEHMNRLWQLSTGSLLTTCAGDDIAEPNKVERLVEVWQAGGGKVMAVHSCMMKIDENGQELGLRFPTKVSTENPSPKNWIAASAYAVGATALYDRRLIEFFGFLPDYTLVEDGPMFFRAALLGQIAYVNEPLTRHRIGGLSSVQHVNMSPGAQFLQGHRLRTKSWFVANARCALADMEKVEFPEKDECATMLHKRIEYHEFEVSLWKANLFRRFLMIPEGVRRSVSMRSSHPLRQALRHTFRPLFISYFNLRYGAAGPRRAPYRRR
jgi:glycosyltransferase involved in cell wall biosynthesis